jgi:hypothetical protein
MLRLPAIPAARLARRRAPRLSCPRAGQAQYTQGNPYNHHYRGNGSNGWHGNGSNGWNGAAR